jgi:hypothetical protein
MRRISEYIFSISVAILITHGSLKGQDTINFPLRVGAGIALHAPVSAISGLYPQGIEVNGFYDLNERISIAIDGGYSRFKNKNFNYLYKNSGFYMRAGIDYNLLNPILAGGRYFAGLSMRYGLSLFSHETPTIDYNNYWGSYGTSEANSFNSAHFLEVSPGVRAELFSNFFIGWSVNVRVLLWSGTGDHQRAIDVPGFGNGSKSFSTGINYYISIRIPYKSKRVIYLKPVRDVDDEQVTGTNGRGDD